MIWSQSHLREADSAHFRPPLSDRLEKIPQEARQRYREHVPESEEHLFPRAVLSRYVTLLERAYMTPAGVDRATQFRRLRNYERKLATKRGSVRRIEDYWSSSSSSAS